jgi:hypothetical protein
MLHVALASLLLGACGQPPAAVDTIPPFVQITSPAQGSVVTASVATVVAGIAHDAETGLDRIEVYAGAVPIGRAVIDTATVPAVWSSSFVPRVPGDYVVRAVAVDVVGNRSESSVGFTALAPVGALGWSRQVGRGGFDGAYAVAVGASGHVYVAGATEGAVGATNQGGTDVFLRAYDAVGSVLWSAQVGSAGNDYVRGIFVDESAGNVWMTGEAYDTFGTTDVMVWRYDLSDGSTEPRSFGSDGDDFGQAIAADASGNVYVAGSTHADLGSGGSTLQAFLMKYDAAGDVAWVVRRGAGQARGLALDAAGHPHIAGYANGDAFASRYTPEGAHVWTAAFGSASIELAFGIAVDAAGRAFVVGGERDAFLTRVDADGTVAWTRQFGSDAVDTATGVATDAFGNVFVVGATNGDLAGTIGGWDVFLRKYDGDGGVWWTRQFGTPGGDGGEAVATDGFGSAYVVGLTSGDLGGPNQGNNDAFVRKFGP